MNSATTLLSVKVDKTERKRLEALAAVRKRTPHYLMREAMSEYLAREEAKESFYQEALLAWREHQAGGLAVPHAEVDAWLASIGTTKELPTPKPRA